MRIAFITLAVLLTAISCTPSPAPPAALPAAEQAAAPCEPGTSATEAPRCAAASAEAALTWADVANDPQAIGHWRANATETLASFGGDASPPAFTFGCERGFLQIERIFSRPHGVALGQNAPLNVLIPRGTTVYSAAPDSTGAPRLWAAAPRFDPRLDDLVASEDGFAIQTAGDITRFRHDPMLARVLANCRR